MLSFVIIKTQLDLHVVRRFEMILTYLACLEIPLTPCPEMYENTSKILDLFKNITNPKNQEFKKIQLKCVVEPMIYRTTGEYTNH